ncbi:MAG: AMP-binding protein [Clostridium sp.]|uniref:AMP-binding protein n=1 Tax=Clostridium sp. TaxID=1506 RepID=UPI002FC9B31E
MKLGKYRLAERLESVCNKYKETVAIIYARDNGNREEYTFGEIKKNAEELVTKLASIGIKSGDRIGIVGANSPWWITALFGSLKSETTSVLIDSSLPSDEIDRLIKNSDLSCLFIYDEIFDALNKEDYKNFPVYSLDKGYNLINGCSVKKEIMDIDEDVFAIIYSSGTTSSAKGVMVTYDSMDLASKVCIENYYTGYRKKVLNIMPPFHIAGLTFFTSCFLLGCETFIIEKPSPVKLSAAFQEYKPTSFGAVPKVYDVFLEKIELGLKSKGNFFRNTMMKMNKASIFTRKNLKINIGKGIFSPINKQAFGGNLREFFCGAAMISRETADFYFGFGVEFYAMYGLTETNIPVTTTVPSEYSPGTNGSIVGKGVKVKIGEPDHNGIGEILIKTPCMMKGYFRDEKTTSEAFNEEGYFKTGDLGILDLNGKLVITGRSKEIIVLQTGKKVAPIDIEALYKDVEGIEDIACCGINVKDKGYDEIHLFVIASDKEAVNKAILERSAELTSSFRTTGIHFVESIPATTLGKVKRHLLKEMATTVQEEVACECRSEEYTPESNIISMVYKIKKDLVSRGVNVTVSSRLQEELGFDSISMAELSFNVENEYGVDISMKIGPQFTVGDVIEIATCGASSRTSEKRFYDIEKFPAIRNAAHNLVFRMSVEALKVFWKFQVKGIENIPDDQGYILCPNHETNLDGLWVAGSLPKKHRKSYFCLAKEEIAKNKVGQFFLRVFGGIPVNRTGNSTPALKRCLEVLNKRNILLIHPEGTRTDDGNLKEFKEGAAKLALDSETPIIPVKIKGGYNVYPKGRFMPKLFNFKSFSRHKIEIVFGKPICPKGKTIAEINAAIKKEIISI